MQLQAKPAYWGIVDPKQLPGYGLKFTDTQKWTEPSQLSLTLTATNGNVGPAYATQINGFELQQVAGPRCSPVVNAPGSYPIALGDLAVSGSASSTFTVLKAPWSQQPTKPEPTCNGSSRQRSGMVSPLIAEVPI